MSNKSGSSTPQSERSTRSSARLAAQQPAGDGNVSPTRSSQSRDPAGSQDAAANFVSPAAQRGANASKVGHSGQETPQQSQTGHILAGTPKSGFEFSSQNSVGDEGRRSPTIVSDAPSSPLAYGSVATSSQQRRFAGAPNSPGTALSSAQPASSASASRFGTSRTPHRRRADIGAYFNSATDSPRHLVSAPHTQSQSQAEAAAGVQTQADDVGETLAPQLVVWGTDVSVARCQERFRRFLREFRLSDFIESGTGSIEDGDTYANVAEPAAPFYMQKLDEIRLIEEPFVALNCTHLKWFDASLYRQLVTYPVEVIPALDIAVNQEFFTKYPDTDLEHQIQVLPFNVDKVRNMRSLNPEHIDQLIGINGMVIRTSAIIPEMREGYFECTVCAHAVTVEIDRGFIREPTSCSHCQSAHSLTLIHNRSSFTDKQLIKVQESPDEMPAGQTPVTALVFAHNELVDRVQPGDRIHVTGIFRAVPVRVNPRQRTVRAVYRTYIDALHLRKVTENKLAAPADAAADRQPDSLGWLTSERRAQLERLHAAPDLYERLAHALAPSIYEHEDVKKGILLQLFGGTPKRTTEAERGSGGMTVGRGQFRAEINVLLCGDPSTSKSQLLRYVHSIVPRSQYASGKGTSAVGLTAYVTKDPDTRQVALQTGALVLADNGVCCIDEFDKMSEAARTILHEALEQQTISIAKAGIICTLNARTSVLAAANPTESRWNMRKTIVENIQLPHTLMSRFDLIFLLLDPQDDAHDARLARHLVALYHKAPVGDVDTTDSVDLALLRDYLAFSRTEYHPRLSEEACEALVSEYVEMRRLSAGRGQVTAYPRQLESLIRLAEAHARLRWSEQVQLIDVREARRLHREALKQSATDPQTGLIDIGILATGMSSSRRRRQRELADALRAIITAKQRKTLTAKALLLEARTTVPLQLTRDLFEDALNLLQDDGVVVWSENTIRVL